MKRIFSIEEKLSAIGLVFQGESTRSVSRKLHLSHHILYEWIESYNSRGDSSRGDRYLSHSSRHTQVPVPATTSARTGPAAKQAQF